MLCLETVAVVFKWLIDRVISVPTVFLICSDMVSFCIFNFIYVYINHMKENCFTLKLLI